MPRAINSLSPRTKFAKRHYEAIALAMQEAVTLCGTSEDHREAMSFAVRVLADLFASDTSMFKRDRFMHACEPGANVRARSNGGSR